MSDIETIGLALQTDGVERGIRSLDELAARGPKVEKSMKGIEAAATGAGKGVSSLGAANAKGLDDVARAGERAAQGLGKIGGAAKSATSSQQALAAAVAQFTAEEKRYVQSLVDEAKQLGMTRAGRAEYIAQSRGMSSAAQEVARAVGDKIDALKREQAAMKESSSASSMLGTSLKSIGVGVSIGAVVAMAKSLGTELYSASAAAERLRIGLDFASARGGAAEIAYLRKVTGDLGLEFGSAAQAYQQFAAAARGTALEGDKARAVFESVAKASAVMGLRADQTSGVLLALQQMVSKGTVQAEELRGQLGERLPGAFQIAAKAMGVTTAELGKMLEQGRVVADDFLPKFARALEENLGGAAEKAANRLDAATNRFNSAFERMKQNAGDSGISTFWAGQMNILTDGMDNFSQKVEAARASGSGFFGQMLAGAGAALQFVNPLNAVAYSALETGNRLKEAEQRLKELDAAGAKRSSNLMLREAYADTARLVEKLREAKAALGALSGGGTQDPRHIPAQQTRGASLARYEAQRAENEKKLTEERMRALGVNKQYTDSLKTYQDALALGNLTMPEYVEAVSDLAKRTWDASTAGKAAAKSAKGVADTWVEGREAAKGWADVMQKAASGIDSVHASTQGLNQAEAALQQYLASPVYAQNTQAQRDMAIARLQDWDAAIKQAAVQKSAIAAYKESEAAAQKLLQAQQGRAAAAQKAVQDARDEEQAASLAAASNISLAEAVAQIALARAEDAYQKALGQQADGATLLALQKEIDARRELVGLIGSRESRKASRDAAKKAADDWEKAADQINQSLTDSLLRGFESGKDFAKNLRDTVVNMFKTMVLRPVISAVLSPVSGAIAGVMGGGGAAGALGGGAGGTGILSMASNAYSLGSNAYSLYNGGLSSFTAPGSMYYNFATSSLGQSWGLSNAAPIMGNNPSAYMPAGTQLTNPFSGAMGGASGSATGTMAGFGAFAAVAALVLNAVGAFRSERTVGGGLRGTLGEGDLTPYTVVRDGGTLFSGPDFRIEDEGKRLADLEQRLADLRASGQGASREAYETQQTLNARRDLYGPMLEAAKKQSDDIQAAYGKLRDNAVAMADALGLSSDKVRDFTQAFGTDEVHPDLNAGVGVDTQGLTAEEAAAKIAEALATANNTLAEQLIGHWETTTETVRRTRQDVGPIDGDLGIVGQYSEYEEVLTNTRYVASELARDGEQAIDTLTRLATNITTVNQAFDTLGWSLYQTSLAGADAANKFADLLGGLDAFNQVTSSYYQNFYSEGERTAKGRETVGKQLGDLGVTIDLGAADARAQYRQAVEAAMAAASWESTHGTGSTAAAERAAALLQLNSSLASVTTAAQAAAQAMGQQSRATNSVTSAQRAQQDAMRETVDALQSAIDMLRDNAKSLVGEVDAAVQMLAARGMVYVESALAGVRAGASITDYTDLEGAIDAARAGIDQGAYATQFERDRDALVLAGQLSDLADAGDQELSIAQKQLDQLEQINAAVSASSGYTQPASSFYTSGGSTSAGKNGADGVAAHLDAVDTWMDKWRGTGNVQGMLLDARARDYTLGDLSTVGGWGYDDLVKRAKEYGIPAFAVGTNYVPRDMLAQIHEGEAIVPKAYNPWASGQAVGGGNAELVAEVRALREQSARLEARLQAIERQTEGLPQLVQQFDDVSEGGNALRTEVMA